MRARLVGAVLSTALAAASLPLLAGTAPAAAAATPKADFVAAPSTTWQTDGTVWTVAAGSSGAALGKVFVGGAFDHLVPPGNAFGDVSGGQAATNFAVLDAATGTPSTTCSNITGFDYPTSHTASIVNSLALSPDGNTLYVGGFFSEVDFSDSTTAPAQYIKALDLANGCTVKAWSVFPSGPVRTITATASTVWFGGDFTQVGASTGYRGAASASTSGTVSSWKPSFIPDNDPNQVAVQKSTLSGGAPSRTLDGTASYVSASTSCGSATATDCGTTAANAGIVRSTVTLGAAPPAGTSFSVTVYGGTDAALGRVVGVPCTITAPATSCTVTGLTNNTLPDSVASGEVVRIAITRTAGTGTVTTGVTTATTITNYRGTITKIVPAPNGSGVLVAGYFVAANNVATRSLAVVDATTGTSTVKAFATPTYVDTNSVVKDIWSDGTNFYTANEGSGQGVFDGRLAVRWSDYAVQWKDVCLGATQAVLAYNGTLYAASHGHDCSGNTAVEEWPDGIRHHLHAQPTSGATNPPAFVPWFPDTGDCHYNNSGVCDMNAGRAVEGIGPRALAVATDATKTKHWMYVVGEFTSVLNPSTGGYDAQMGITRYAAQGDAGVVSAAPGASTINVSADQPGVVRVTWRPGVDRDSGNLTFTVRRWVGAAPESSATTVYTTTATSWPWKRQQLTFNDTNVTAGTTYHYRVYTADDKTTIPAAGTESVYPGTAGQATATDTTTPYARAVLASSPTLYLRYDQPSGSGFLSDSSDHAGIGNNLSLSDAALGGSSFTSGGAVWGPSTALSLGGAAGQTSWSESRFASPASYSIETWFKAGSGANGKLVGFGNKQSAMSDKFDKMIWLQGGVVYFGAGGAASCSSGTNSVCFGAGGGVNDHELFSGGGLDNGAWHHVVATQGTSGMALYVDGVKVASNGSTANQSYLGYWHVGGDRISSPWQNVPSQCTTNGGCPFTGQLDETAVYPTALSATTVANHFAVRSTAGASGGGSGTTASVSISPPTTPQYGSAVPIPFTASTTPNNGDYPWLVTLYAGATQVDSFACPATGPTCSGSFSFDDRAYAGPVGLSATVQTLYGTSGQSTPKTLLARTGTSVALTTVAPARGGSSVTLKGKVTATNTGKGLGSVPVVITAKPKVGAASPVTATVTTAANGTFAKTFTLPSSTTFTATVSAPAGSWWTTSTLAAVQQMTAAMTCTKSASSVRSGGYVTVTCKALGMPTGTPFTVYRYMNGHWYDSGFHGTASKGVMTVKVRLRAKGTTTILRVYTPATSPYAATWGPTMPVKIV